MNSDLLYPWAVTGAVPTKEVHIGEHLGDLDFRGPFGEYFPQDFRYWGARENESGRYRAARAASGYHQYESSVTGQPVGF